MPKKNTQSFSSSIINFFFQYIDLFKKVYYYKQTFFSILLISSWLIPMYLFRIFIELLSNLFDTKVINNFFNRQSFIF